MTWTYAGNFSLSRDQVRWHVGDTDTNDQLATDEEIAFALTEDPNAYMAAAAVCEAIAIKVGQRLTVSAGGSGIDADEQYRHWKERAASLREKGSASGVAPFAGGLSISGKVSVDSDTDRIRPTFTRTLHAGPGDSLGSTRSELERVG